MVLIIMGVVGAGKTTVGELLAERLGWQFADADSFHSPESVDKIRHGIALTDADRVPWLASLRAAIDKWNSEKANMVLACSALKHRYREELRARDVKFVYLKGRGELILSRLRARHGHFATESILETQLADLEEPKDAVIVQIDKSPDEIVSEIVQRLKLAASSSE